MAYVPFGPINKSTGAAYRDKTATGAAHKSGISAQNKVLDYKLQNIDLMYNQSVLKNSGIDDGTYSKAAYDMVSGIASDPIYSNDPVFQDKIIPYMKKYTEAQTKAQFGNSTPEEKNAIIQKMKLDMDSNVGEDNHLNPQDAQTALDNWLSVKGNTVGTFVTNFKQYLNDNTDYPGIKNKKSETLYQHIFDFLGKII